MMVLSLKHKEAVKPLAAFHARLHQWYGRHGRKDLPWRNTHDPYAIYISEIMLQQTQVKTVLERYYFPFLKRFPTLAALGAARRDDVLRAWQGLGYYNRAINLHKAAKQCGNALPETVENLTTLPGIGRNTAHAIAAFAYHQPVAVMEANVRRVLARIFAFKQINDGELWDKAQALLDKENPFDYNQAMMDIGSLICTKRAPRCDECPASGICQGKHSPASYPAPKTKKTVPVHRKHIVVMLSPEGKYFATPRQSRFLNGLYHFKEMDDTPDGQRLGNIRQQYSHFTLEAEVWLERSPQKGKDWYTLAGLKKLPMSMAEKKILALLPAIR
jgi:A/G-specific adenine glycosylase